MMKGMMMIIIIIMKMMIIKMIQYNTIQKGIIL